eukprot:RCo047160
MSCGLTQDKLLQLLEKCTSTDSFLYKQHFYEESKDGVLCTYCKACKVKGRPGKMIADHPAEASDRTLIAGQKSPSSKRVRAQVTLERVVGDGDKTLKIKIPDCLVDDGYSGTICFQPKFAKKLGLHKQKSPAHKIKLGDGSVVDEYAYALPKSKGMVLKLEFTDPAAKRKKVEHCILEKVFHDPEENIIGADALARMTLCVEPGKGVRQALAHK